MVKAIHKNGINLLICRLMVAGLSSFALCALAQEEKVFNVDDWSDSIAHDTIHNFDKETGIKVCYDTYDNNEILHANLAAGETGYDIVVPSSTFARLQIDGGLLTQLDVAQLLNLKNLDPEIQTQIANIDSGNQHTTIGVNTAKLKSLPGSESIPDNVWGLFFTPTLQPELTPASKQDSKP